MGKLENAKWYVIHTSTGYEALAKDGLEKMVENYNLQDTIFEIKIPTEETIEEKNGKKKIVTRKLYPCYVFMKMDYSNDLWFLIRNTRGVTGFVGPQGHPMALTPDEVRRNHLEGDDGVINYVVGDTIKVISSALSGSTGVVLDINNASKKVKVRVEVFGRETDVELGLGDIEKLDSRA